METITTREKLVQEIADAMQMYLEEGQYYLNLTTQEVGAWIDPALVGEDCLWPNEGDEVVRIDPLSSRESFQGMVDFADQQPEKTANKLYRALNGSRPFARFRAAVDILDLLQDWYAFKNDFYLRQAEEWMRDNDVDFIDGKIVCKKVHLIWYNEEDE